MADARPDARVERLRETVARFRDAYRRARAEAPPARRDRYPALDVEVAALASAADSLAGDLRYRSGDFVRHLEQVEYRALVIGDRLRRLPPQDGVRHRWDLVEGAVADVRMLVRAAGGTAGVYRAQDDPAGTVRVDLPTPRPAFDASEEVEDVRVGLNRLFAAWAAGSAGSSGSRAPWVARLEPELAALGRDLGELGGVDPHQKAAVAAVAQRLRDRCERIRPLMEVWETELPDPLVAAWKQAAFRVAILADRTR